MKNEALFMPTVKLQLQMDGINIPIIRSALGEEAAIIGASSIEVNQ